MTNPFKTPNKRKERGFKNIYASYEQKNFKESSDVEDDFEFEEDIQEEGDSFEFDNHESDNEMI